MLYDASFFFSAQSHIILLSRFPVDFVCCYFLFPRQYQMMTILLHCEICLFTLSIKHKNHVLEASKHFHKNVPQSDRQLFRQSVRLSVAPKRKYFVMNVLRCYYARPSFFDCFHCLHNNRKQFNQMIRSRSSAYKHHHLHYFNSVEYRRQYTSIRKDYLLSVGLITCLSD